MDKFSLAGIVAEDIFSDFTRQLRFKTHEFAVRKGAERRLVIIYAYADNAAW